MTTRIKKNYLIASSLIISLFLILSNGYLDTIVGDITNFNDFFVVSVVFNPLSYKRRYEIYKQFEKHIQSFGVKLITVELAFQNQKHVLTKSNNPYHIQLRTNDLLWYKENLINIAIRRLPSHCKYVAWIDGDIVFLNSNWLQETIHALDTKYHVVQLFKYASFLGPNNAPAIRVDIGFGYSFAIKKIYMPKYYVPFKLHDDNDVTSTQNNKSKDGKNGLVYWHPGFAWAAKRQTLLNINGLFEYGILGGGDRMMAFAFIGRIDDGLPKNITKYYKYELLKWNKLVKKYVNKKVGYIDGTVNHVYHGSILDRQYANRERILSQIPFLYNPAKHLYHDEFNVLRLSKKLKDYLSNAIYHFYLNRKEDKDDTLPSQ